MAPCLLVLCALGAGAALAAPSQADVRPVPFQRGITLAEWGPTGYAPAAVRARLRTLKFRYHVDTVTLLLVWNQDDLTSSTVQPGPQTVPTSRLVAAIRSARRLGLRVVLRPYVDPTTGWRGGLKPARLAEWCASYRAFILRYADLARRERAGGFVIGSEMVSLSGHTAFWRSLARQVRRRFPGFVAYEANYDETVTWWRSVDVISVSAYYHLATKRRYTVLDLLDGWQPYYWNLHQTQMRMHRPVMFGEIGYRSVKGSAMVPWDFDTVAPRSAEAQRLAYEAAFQKWFFVPWFRGMHWWYVSAQDELLDGHVGADHRPLGPALRTVGRWYSRRR